MAAGGPPGSSQQYSLTNEQGENKAKIRMDFQLGSSAVLLIGFSQDVAVPGGGET